jgi:class 3 adenylate cyclase
MLTGFWKNASSKTAFARKAVFNMDYTSATRFVPALFWIGVPAECLFFLFETSQGYWDSLPLRLIVISCFCSLILVNWKGRGRWSSFLLWESALLFIIPVHTTISFLQNEGIPYYQQSLGLMFLLLGMLTKPWMIPVHSFLGVGVVTFIYFRIYGFDQKVLDGTISTLVNANFMAISSAGIMIVLEGYNRRIMESKVALAKAEEEKLKAIEMAEAYAELKKREELIRIFVRPSLVDEIHAGKDPSKFKPEIRSLAIMFCDIRDFTRLTEVLSPYEKQDFLNHYFSMMTHPIVQNGGEVDKIIGDSVMGVFPSGDCAVKAAIDMRLQLQKFNQGMFSAGTPKIRNGIGIAKGEVMQGNFGSFEKMDRTVIGEAVNIASRLESKTKMYNLEVVVTEDVINDLQPGSTHYRWIDIVQVKGSTRHLRLYEIYGHQPLDVRQYKDDTRELLEKALTIYFHKGFKDASRLFRAMLEKVPPHRHTPNDLMDNILRYYIAHCEAWINDRSGAWEQIEKWEGVHIFTEK